MARRNSLELIKSNLIILVGMIYCKKNKIKVFLFTEKRYYQLYFNKLNNFYHNNIIHHIEKKLNTQFIFTQLY